MVGQDHSVVLLFACLIRCCRLQWCTHIEDCRQVYLRRWFGGVDTDDRLARWIDDLVFPQIGRKTGFDPMEAYMVVHSGEEADWSRVDLEYPFFRSFSIAGLRGR